HSGTSYSPQSFVGTTPPYATARDYQLETGGFFTNSDVKKRNRVLVLGPTVASNLFPGQNPVGQTVQVGGVDYEVVGLTKSKGSNGAQDQDDVAMAPITAVQDTLTGYGDIDQIVVQGRSRSALNAADSEVTTVLDQRHDIASAAIGILGSQFKIAGVHPAVAPYSIFLAFGAAVATGLFFGTYPASRAARMRPIEALRFE